MGTEDRELVRFWLTFDLSGLGPEPPTTRHVVVDGGSFAYRFCGRGVGVTGYDYDDCLRLLGDALSPDSIPPVVTCERDVDVDALALDHRFVGVAVWRGVWFPSQHGGGPVID